MALPDDEHHAELGVVNTQPSRTESPRYQALLAAVEAGAIPASALNEEEEDEEEEELGETRDDERSGTRYNVRIYALFFVACTDKIFPVRLVPHHLRHCGDVRRDAAD